MPFNGAGVFNRLFNWQQDAENGIDIMADRMDGEFDSIAGGLSICLTRDGQSIMQANLDMAGFKIIRLGAPTLDTDAVNKGYLGTNFIPKSNEIVIEGVPPMITFKNTGQVLPAGLYRIAAIGDTFRAQKNTSVAGDFATSIDIWSYNVNIDTLTFTPAVTIASMLTIAFADSGNALKIDTGYPSIWFHDTTPGDAPASADLAMTAGNGWFRFGNADATGVLTASTFAINPITPVVTSYVPFDARAGITASGNSPSLQFNEGDQTDPAGRYRFSLDGGNFSLQKAATANFATTDLIWQHRAPDMGGTDTFNIYKGVSLGGIVGTSTASLKIDASYPSIWFSDSSPSGSYPNLMLTAGNSTMRFGTADADGGAFDPFMVASPSDIFTVPNTRLAVTGGTVELGSTTGASLEMKRASSYNYIKAPDGAVLRISNMSGTAWATINSATGWAAGTSDARMKQNIEPISYGLDTVMSLRPVQFDWIEGGKHDIGFIAQEVEHVIPEIVEIWEADPDIEGDKDTYAMRKDALVAVLVKAVQEQQQHIARLEERLVAGGL